MENISIYESIIREFWDMDISADIIDVNNKIFISENIYISRKAIKHVIYLHNIKTVSYMDPL